MKASLIKSASLGLGFIRTLNFTTQSALLPLLDKWAGGNKDKSFLKFTEHLKEAFPKVQKLLDLDAENITQGFYPLAVLFQESPWEHYSRLPFLVRDAIRANLQRRDKQTSVFEEDDLSYVDQTPKYYQRNFHFQNGGYLNDESAKLYDHQVEILFSGTAKAMRRQIIPRMKEHFHFSDGAGLKFLEIGSGTGSLTRDLALAFPKAHVTCLDASPHYLKRAQNNLKDFKRISFLQGFGENLDFKNETFDAVFSCYVFHELPLSVRKSVVAEKLRVLKKSGFVGIVDSIQKDDDPNLNWALQQFPVDFHEPFYKNYTENKLEKLLSDVNAKDISVDIHFLSKIVCARKV